MLDENEMHQAPRGKSSVMPWAILLVVILAILIGAVMFRDRIMPKNSSNSNNPAAKAGTPSGYQSVFLVNGQVYFGKLSGTNEQYMTLEDVYYLQVVQPTLQGSQQQGQQAAAADQSQLTLRKLGRDELHGPVDTMKINRDQVLFYEDINEEGEVMKAIRKDQANPPAPAAQAPANSNTAAPAANSNTPAPQQ
jgi:hypothetical protein